MWCQIPGPGLDHLTLFLMAERGGGRPSPPRRKTLGTKVNQTHTVRQWKALWVSMSLGDGECNNGETCQQHRLPQSTSNSHTPQSQENPGCLSTRKPEGREANEILNGIPCPLTCRALRMGANVAQYKVHFSFQEQFQPGAKMRKDSKYTNGLLFFHCHVFTHENGLLL